MSAWFAFLFAAAAQPADPSPPPSAIKPARICRESERHTGSHIRSRRRCLTEEQWRVEDERRNRTPTTLRVTEGQNDTGPTRPQ